MSTTTIGKACANLARLITLAVKGRQSRILAIPEELPAIRDLCPRIDELIAGLSGDEDTVDRTSSAALVAQMLCVIKDSILADGKFTSDEASAAAEMLYPVFDGFDTPLGYSRFRPIAPDKLLALYRQWDDDDSLFGGKWDGDNAALSSPFQWCAWLAAAAMGNTEVFEQYETLFPYIIQVITMEGGVTAAEERLLDAFKESNTLMRQWLDLYLEAKTL